MFYEFNSIYFELNSIKKIYRMLTWQVTWQVTWRGQKRRHQVATYETTACHTVYMGARVCT